MNQEHLQQDKYLKRVITYTGFLSSLGGLLLGLFVLYGFYYSTKGTQTNHTNSITDLKKDVKEITVKINDAEKFQGISQSEQRAMQDKVEVIEKKLDKLDDKLDRILTQTSR